jgi:hypothetical protein
VVTRRRPASWKPGGGTIEVSGTSENDRSGHADMMV